MIDYYTSNVHYSYTTPALTEEVKKYACVTQSGSFLTTIDGCTGYSFSSYPIYFTYLEAKELAEKYTLDSSYWASVFKLDSICKPVPKIEWDYK